MSAATTSMEVGGAAREKQRGGLRGQQELTAGGGPRLGLGWGKAASQDSRTSTRSLSGNTDTGPSLGLAATREGTQGSRGHHSKHIRGSQCGKGTLGVRPHCAVT